MHKMQIQGHYIIVSIKSLSCIESSIQKLQLNIFKKNCDFLFKKHHNGIVTQTIKSSDFLWLQYVFAPKAIHIKKLEK